MRFERMIAREPSRVEDGDGELAEELAADAGG